MAVSDSGEAFKVGVIGGDDVVAVVGEEYDSRVDDVGHFRGAKELSGEPS